MRPIDADALKEKIEIDNFDSPMMNPVMTMTKVLEYIDEAPTIEPDRPHGEWIVDKIFGTVKCPKCSCEIVPNDMLNGEANFCPNCGADMRKEGSKMEVPDD